MCRTSLPLFPLDPLRLPLRPDPPIYHISATADHARDRREINNDPDTNMTMSGQRATLRKRHLLHIFHLQVDGTRCRILRLSVYQRRAEVVAMIVDQNQRSRSILRLQFLRSCFHLREVTLAVSHQEDILQVFHLVACPLVNIQAAFHPAASL